jgi:hypothetical protein
MKTKSKISGHIIRSAAYAVVFLLTIVALTSAFNLSNRSLKPAVAVRLSGNAPMIPNQARALGFADRIAYQRAIEDVYWRHRIWPKANAGAKPPLDEVMSQAQMEKKVEDYLRNSQALEDYWQRPITPDQLQAEMERMASDTKQPGVLREIFAALGNDPFVIAECLARPVLAERLVTGLYAHDQRSHGELKRRAEAELRTHRGVKQMKQTSGTYTETEWVKSDSTPDQDKGGSASREDDGKANGQRPGTEPNVKMNSSEWQESVEKLAKEFGFGVRSRRGGVSAFKSADMSAHSKKPTVPGEYKTLPVGKVSSLQEDDAHYYVTAVLNKGKDRLKLATIAWLKEPLRSWLAKAEAQAPVTMAAVSANYTLPVISAPSAGCADDTWTPTSTTNAPVARRLHTAIWTGSEMIVWGGAVNGPEVNTGGRYNPSTDSWTATSTTNAPEARIYHTALWTGSEMIVWGGLDGITLLDTGGKYNPGTDSWIATSTTNTPEPREDHTAVWTGSEMIVWGGCCTPITGGRYNPGTDSWTATSTTGAPTARFFHTAVWSGSEMIVWGGNDETFNNTNTGGRYSPTGDSWVATNLGNAPSPRDLHSAVWSGSEMIVWGGIEGGSTISTPAANTARRLQRHIRRFSLVRSRWAAAGSISSFPTARRLATTATSLTRITSTTSTWVSSISSMPIMLTMPSTSMILLLARSFTTARALSLISMTSA